MSLKHSILSFIPDAPGMTDFGKIKGTHRVA